MWWYHQDNEMLCNLLPGNSTKTNGLHQRPAEVEQHIPQTIHCLPQDASLGNLIEHWNDTNLEKSLIENWNDTNLRSKKVLTSTPVVPSLRVTLVRDIACHIHCIDSSSQKKKRTRFLRILHGRALADHKLGVSHQSRIFCQQPEISWQFDPNNLCLN